MMTGALLFLKVNPLAGLGTHPFHGLRRWLPAAVLYATLALVTALATGLVNPALVPPPLFFILPFTLLIFPVLLEESFFRGLLIPRQILDRGTKHAAVSIVLSSLFFVAWHPLNALTVNPTARHIFLRPDFLAITFFLGLACGFGYVVSRSLWVPILIHWATVLAWVLFLGGRNLLLE
jgi:uncharacterized protein